MEGSGSRAGSVQINPDPAIQDAQKHTDPKDLDPAREHCLEDTVKRQT